MFKQLLFNPQKKKCRTDDDISPSKISRRKKGKGSGSIHYRTIKKKNKEYKQAYYHYEFWRDGDRYFTSTVALASLPNTSTKRTAIVLLPAGNS